MAHQTASGTVLGISLAAPAAHTIAAFDALTFTTVGELTEVGEFGKEWAVVTHNPLSSRGTKKGKGTFNNGVLSPSLALDNDDAGQEAMITARESVGNAYFMIQLQDGTIYYLSGIVVSFKSGIRNGDSVVDAKATIEIQDSEILRKKSS